MIKSVLRFYTVQEPTQGKSIFDAPSDTSKYYSFWVVSSPWKEPGSGVASILPLTTGSSEIPGIEAHHLVLSGGEDAAYKKAVLSLKSNGALSGLGVFEQLDSSEG